jgi:hypothetical protein
LEGLKIPRGEGMGKLDVVEYVREENLYTVKLQDRRFFTPPA